MSFFSRPPEEVAKGRFRRTAKDLVGKVPDDVLNIASESWWIMDREIPLEQYIPRMLQPDRPEAVFARWYGSYMSRLAASDPVTYQFCLEGLARRYGVPQLGPLWPPMKLVEEYMLPSGDGTVEDWLFDIARQDGPPAVETS